METPKIYVGTYAKYNNGSIAGAWLELDNYSDKDDFLEACAELHSDEEDPEFMFQDWENIPDEYISESSISDEFWEYQEMMNELSTDEQEAFKVFVKNGSGSDVDKFRDAYQGYYGGAFKDAELEFTYQLVDDLGYLSEMPEHLQNYFDYDAFKRDLFISDYWEQDGYVFRNL